MVDTVIGNALFSKRVPLYFMIIDADTAVCMVSNSDSDRKFSSYPAGNSALNFALSRLVLSDLIILLLS